MGLHSVGVELIAGEPSNVAFRSAAIPMCTEPTDFTTDGSFPGRRRR